MEIYKDVAIRMAPLRDEDVRSMKEELKGSRLLAGYRGRPPIHLQSLTDAVVRFSDLALKMEGRFSSMEVNPLICNAERCVAADARIMLPDSKTGDGGAGHS